MTEASVRGEDGGVVAGTTDGETAAGDVVATEGVEASSGDGGRVVAGTADRESAFGEVAATIEVGAL